ncbi:MAG: hypothetical protein ACYS21_08060, partial [Planctomycetota bacterium]
MCKNLFYLASFILVLGLTTLPAAAGVDYGEPDGGWTYIYDGAGVAVGDPDGTEGYNALDGTWNHNNGSDELDTTGNNWEIGGGGDPGGIKALVEGGITLLRLQDCGDPRDHDSAGEWNDPSNRKLYFTHRMSDDGIDSTVGDTILDTGVTISFRARLATTPPLDDLFGNGGSPTGPWPAGGNGYGIHHGGKGNFGVHQGTSDGDGQVAFSLILAGDEEGGDKNPDRSGLCMPNLNGTSISGEVDIEGNDDGTLNLLDIDDLTIWHEFWITIQADTSGGGTHKVSIYMDGSGTPTEFHVTASNDTEDAGDGANISMGMGSTDSHGAFDVDFFAYKPGIITPAPSNPNLARALNPPVGATVALSDATPLSWTPGVTAAKHDVYFGTNQADVNDADASDTTGIYQGQQPLPIFNPAEDLELGQTYYWRIDEVEANDTIHKGDVWSFTILDHIPIDDMEAYNYDDNQIWHAWTDGQGWPDEIPPWPGNGSGSVMDIGTDVAQGSQSLSYSYDNDGTNSLGTTGKAYYSEAKMTLTASRDWTTSGVKALSLMFIGYPEDVGNFTEGPAGTYTVTGAGANIENESDEFHFAYKVLNGAGSIIAKVESVENTHPWAKAGVMIRDTLDADSAHAMVAITPGNGVWFGRRTATGNDTDTDELDGITASYWVRLVRTPGGAFRAYYSVDGNTWDQLGSLTSVGMGLPMYVGLAVTSHEAGVACEAVFSNVTSDGTGPWFNEDIGITSNGAESMYVAISNNNGTTGTVYYDDNDNVDPNASLIDDWTEWNIDLKDFSDQGVDLTDVNDIAIGFGTKGNVTTPG